MILLPKPIQAIHKVDYLLWMKAVHQIGNQGYMTIANQMMDQIDDQPKWLAKDQTHEDITQL